MKTRCESCNGTGRCAKCKGTGHFGYPGFGDPKSVQTIATPVAALEYVAHARVKRALEPRELDPGGATQLSPNGQLMEVRQKFSLTIPRNKS